MPRRNRSEPIAPLSFFDEDEGARTGLGIVPKRGRRARVAPSIPRPARTIFKKEHQDETPRARPASVVNTKRYNREQIKHYKELMKTHFGNTRDILDKHVSWPRYATFEKIEDYIDKVKTSYLKPIWEQNDNHKTKVEHIHSKQVDISGWDFASIHKRVSSFAEENDQTNRLTLEKPWASDSGKPYVNVVLAWLFAAKKQLMWTLTVYLRTKKAGDSMADKFVSDSEAGSDARAKFKEFKAKLHKRAPREPAFPDHAALEHQYAVLHPHRAAAMHQG